MLWRKNPDIQFPAAGDSSYDHYVSNDGKWQVSVGAMSGKWRLFKRAAHSDSVWLLVPNLKLETPSDAMREASLRAAIAAASGKH